MPIMTNNNLGRTKNENAYGYYTPQLGPSTSYRPNYLYLSPNTSTKALSPSRYDLQPNPVIFPLQTAEIIETCRKSSRAYTFERCTSTTGI